jgi:hypothetical protein
MTLLLPMLVVLLLMYREPPYIACTGKGIRTEQDNSSRPFNDVLQHNFHFELLASFTCRCEAAMQTIHMYTVGCVGSAAAASCVSCHAVARRLHHILCCQHAKAGLPPYLIASKQAAPDGDCMHTAQPHRPSRPLQRTAALEGAPRH